MSLRLGQRWLKTGLLFSAAPRKTRPWLAAAPPRNILPTFWGKKLICSQSSRFFSSAKPVSEPNAAAKQNEKHNKHHEHRGEGWGHGWTYLEWLETTILGIVFGVIPVSLTINNVIGGLGTTQGTSMQPTLNPRGSLNPDRVFLNRMVQTYKRGDVVVLQSPERPHQYIVKRITALEGDWIQDRSGSVLVVGRGRCWIEGDNPERSRDSHAFGAVPLGLVRARVDFILWPPERWGAVLHTAHGV